MLNRKESVVLLSVASLCASLTLLAPRPCAADGNVAFELLGGIPANLRTPVHISQDGTPDIEFTARYESKPFETPWYYAVSIIRWSRGKMGGATPLDAKQTNARAADGKGWAIDFVHHKLNVVDPPAEVQRFSLTHGFNMLTLRRLWGLSGNVLSLGGGIVITHPESRVRGLPFAETGGIANDGYFVSGPMVTCGVGRRFDVSKRLYVNGEIRATLSYVSVPINQGRTSLVNASIHFLAGAGVKF